MKCPKCGKDYEGKFCSTCGYSADAPASQNPVNQFPVQPPMAPPKKKGKGCLISTIVIVVLAILAIIIVIFATNSPSDSTDPSSPAAGQTQINGSEKLFALNETGKAGDAEITVTNVKKSSGNEYDRPKDGMEYVIVTVKIKNVGSGNLAYNELDYKIKNSNGQITDGTISLSDGNNHLSSGELAPGGTVSGTITFEAPKNDKGLILQYYDNIFSDKVDLSFKLG